MDTLREMFESWIKSIPIKNSPRKINIKHFVSNANIISFNYTNTLEEIYGIENERVLNIHGSVSRNDELIFGHGEGIQNSNDIYVEDLTNEGINHYISNMFIKPVFDIIERHRDTIQNFVIDTYQIHIMGFSIAKADLPYLSYLFSISDTSNMTIFLHNYKKNNHDKMRLKLINCGYKGNFSSFTI